VKEIPLSYRMMLVSIIKESLRKANPTYYQKIYELNKGKMKPFSTAVFLRNYSISDEKISLEQLNYTISSPDQEFILYLYNGLLQLNFLQYQEYKLYRTNIRLVHEREIRSNAVLFRTLSPILVEDREGKPVAPFDPKYPEHLNYYADLILKSYHGFGLRKELIIKPGKMRKQVIKEVMKLSKDEGREGEKLYYTAYKGFLYIKGDPGDLQLLYQLGLSKRRSQGFGLLEIEREEV
ncbi:MAG: CRISPR-associated endoribonuclease Cas6, partial [Firmicutes bacterium]|nr:CRISPR-associated endoribonuclease Cas6 [Bacillota bacterium]